MAEGSAVEPRIRSAHAADGPALLALTERVDAVSPYLSREPGEPPVWYHGDAERDLGSFVGRGNCTAFLAVTPRNDLVGFLTLAGGHWQRNRGSATVSVAVSPEWQGRGLGGALFASAHGWADNSGLHRLELTVVEANEPARHLYRRIGYVEEGTTRASLIRRGVAHDERLMARVMVPAGVPHWTDLVLPAPSGEGAAAARIRCARPADAAELLEFDHSVRVESPFLLRSAAESFPDVAAALHYLDGFDGRNGAAFVAVNGQSILGLAALRRGFLSGIAHEAEMLLVVRRTWWGCGVGGRLAAAAENWACAHAVERLIVRVMAHNRRAITTFTRRGFREEARLACAALVDGRYADQLLLAKTISATHAACALPL